MPQRNTEGASSHQAPRSWASLLVTAIFLASGCSTVTVQSFQATPNSNVEAAYIATGADFSSYSRLLGEDIALVLVLIEKLEKKSLGFGPALMAHLGFDGIQLLLE